MNKKIILNLLAVAAVAMFALPAAASAQEIHWTNTAAFSGTIGASAISVQEEPTVTCESGHFTGTPAAGGTTGTFSYDDTGCHITIGPWTFKCHTSGSALDNTIAMKGTYHLVTVGGKPAILETFERFTIICATIQSSIFTGSLIGTITSPACGAESKSMATSFSTTSGVQNHLEYTGVKYDLIAETEGSGKAKTAGLTSTLTTSQTSAGKLECT